MGDEVPANGSSNFTVKEILLQLMAKVDRMDGKLDLKANAADLLTLERHVDKKADATDLAALEGRVNEQAGQLETLRTIAATQEALAQFKRWLYASSFAAVVSAATAIFLALHGVVS